MNYAQWPRRRLCSSPNRASHWTSTWPTASPRADLRAVKDPAFVIHRYSRAGDPHEAALAAAERWRHEQAG